MPDGELPGYEQLVIPLPDEPTYALEPAGTLVATLVRRNEPTGGRAVLYVHGWNDYFFQAHLADEMAAQGYDFYAVDLRRYGRSLRSRQLAGYVANLTDYFRELDEALSVLVDEGHDRIVLMGHSTGGLVAALWAHERPGAFAALILNAPWLELQANSLLRPATQPVLSAARAVVATTVLPQVDSGFYRRCISRSEEGEWEYNLNLKGDKAFLIRVGWMAAILDGHARVAAGLAIDCPVLVAVSGRSDFRRAWDEGFKVADIVLDVERIAARAPQLGHLVVIARFPDALHDLVLSREDVRGRVFAEYARFLRCYSG
ncbi:alpha/beta hydrolase [Tessaracoccus sp. Z1128]